MNALVYNKITSKFNLGWESHALRAAFILNGGVMAAGDSPYSIHYKAMTTSSKYGLEFKLKHLAKYEEFKQFNQTADEVFKDLKFLKNNRQGGKTSLVLYKKMESAINQMFLVRVNQEVTSMEAMGMIQLADLTSDEGFYPCALENLAGENYGGHQNLSWLLSMEDVGGDIPEKDKISGRFAFMLFDRLVKNNVPDLVELIPLVTLPTLVALNVAQLRNLKRALKPLADRLDKLLLPSPPLADGTRYIAGVWDDAALPQLAQEMQAALDANADMQWAKKMSKNWSSQLYVGMMETPALWQLMRDNDLVPDDTWEVLQKWVQDKHYAPKMPIFDMRIVEGATGLDGPIAIEEIDLHTRKTLDID